MKMEIIIYKTGKATLKYVEEDDITSIDYEILVNKDNFYGGDFIFDKEEALKKYNCFNVDGLVSYCKSILNNEMDIKENWKKIAKDFKSHGVKINADEYEGFDNQFVGGSIDI